MPYLSRIYLKNDHPEGFPFNLPFLKSGLDITLKSNVTFFVGENGIGKSTLLEAIADKCNFNLSGGNRNHNYSFYKTESELSEYLILSWKIKTGQGFFMRAESFFNFATYIDEIAKEDGEILDAYGGRSLHHRSHGEAFLALFNNQFQNGIYILDEPEAALSPLRQLSLLSIIHKLEKAGKAQFIISTHSPILMSYPNSNIFLLNEEIKLTNYKDTEHYQLTRSFLESPEMYFRHLFNDI
ncbi:MULTISPECIES: AAA family ATPase [Chryseobacterium]|jgi:predicted ATPase|uniref:ATPase n=1 Tax=Chryseobacterium geocarposphaerae TaxID=1416776 RepID=A0ABU1LA60_9FLAO|nr:MULTISPECIES: AAA family ATPase [Chryseobacterium]ALR29655.1 AAA family ATPase [Chryseobacterium sp. IHB B 17019]MDR6403608.1 putative ATPase [Chryseobacterium geocarposphaerae]MDR6697162.1 putative ATPase [Chryseobacterium ginsenosidimutans]